MASFDHLLDLYKNYLVVEKGLAANTLESYSRDLTRFFDSLKEHPVSTIEQVENTTILKYLIGLRQEGLGARSRARHLVALRGFFVSSFGRR